MSFSSQVKEELIKIIPAQKHCMKSELAALLYFGEAKYFQNEDEKRLSIITENALIIKKVFTFLKKSFNIRPGVGVYKGSGSRRLSYGVFVDGPVVDKILKELGLKKGSIGLHFSGGINSLDTCCKRAFLRGAFLMLGSVNDPAKSYNLEFYTGSNSAVRYVSEALGELTEDIKINVRKDSTPIYFKDSQVIVDILAAMGAGVSVLNYENQRILNETRGRINRRVNCEIGNLRKVATAGAHQAENIRIIDEKLGIDNLPDSLKEIARLRLDNPEMSLVELGSRLSTPLGKSGVNHRMQKLIAMAGELKEQS